MHRTDIRPVLGKAFSVPTDTPDDLADLLGKIDRACAIADTGQDTGRDMVEVLAELGDRVAERG